MHSTDESPIVVPSADGSPIALWRSGRGPSLIGVHGTGADHHAWDLVVPLLENDFTMYRMDRRGRGGSGDGSAYSLELEFLDVAAAVAAVPPPVLLYGHSFGATCAWEAALRSSSLAGLVLYEGGPKPPVRFIDDKLIDRLERLVAEGRREEALRQFMLTAAGVTEAELAILERQPAWPARVAAAHTIPRELRALNEYGADPSTFARMTVPVLLLVGSDTAPELAQPFAALADSLPDARVRVLPGQRHAAHQTAPDVLAEALRDALPAPREADRRSQAP
jgi:pimeloyl-ACP methyl ester carboxylesterase